MLQKLQYIKSFFMFVIEMEIRSIVEREWRIFCCSNSCSHKALFVAVKAADSKPFAPLNQGTNTLVKLQRFTKWKK